MATAELLCPAKREQITSKLKSCDWQQFHILGGKFVSQRDLKPIWEVPATFQTQVLDLGASPHIHYGMFAPLLRGGICKISKTGYKLGRGLVLHFLCSIYRISMDWCPLASPDSSFNNKVHDKGIQSTSPDHILAQVCRCQGISPCFFKETLEQTAFSQPSKCNVAWKKWTDQQPKSDSLKTEDGRETDVRRFVIDWHALCACMWVGASACCLLWGN